MIYTSYFGNWRNLPLDKCISVARVHPKPYKGYKDLYPSKELLWDYKYNKISVNEYIKRYYKETLSKLNPHKVAKDLDGMVLLCYEAPSNFCHRHLISRWLGEYGVKCVEINNGRM